MSLRLFVVGGGIWIDGARGWSSYGGNDGAMERMLWRELWRVRVLRGVVAP